MDRTNRGHISYCVDCDQRVIFETWTGEISIHELTSHWLVFLADPEVLAVKRTLVDLRRCEISFTGEEWIENLESFVIKNPVASGWVSAVVVNKSYIYGIVRQYLSYTEWVIVGAIFGEFDDALAWLNR